jgi:hypothetical protein
MQPKLFIGPVSKSVIDATIDFANDNNIPLGLIPSRRQIDFIGGYVDFLDNGYGGNTKAFALYVKKKTSLVTLVRDHGGPSQGQTDDDGKESLENDCRSLDIIHIDPWKRYSNYTLGLQETIDLINKASLLNPFIQFEVGTEEAIRKFSVDELDKFVSDLKTRLRPKIFNKIKYLVIQSGTALKGNTNTGLYSSQQLKDMIQISKKFDLISKEHNGDYLPSKLIKQKFKLGLDCINIAPEFGKIESDIIAKQLQEKSDSYVLDFFKICKDSNKWVKWVDKDFKPDDNILETISICGHYVFSYPSFRKLKQILGPEVYIDVKLAIQKRIKEIVK